MSEIERVAKVLRGGEFEAGDLPLKPYEVGLILGGIINADLTELGVIDKSYADIIDVPTFVDGYKNGTEAYDRMRYGSYVYEIDGGRG
jgi:hypothetical protein